MQLSARQKVAACRALLAAHPQVQESLTAELKAAGVLATKAQPEGRRLTHPDLGRLPYLDAVSAMHTLEVGTVKSTIARQSADTAS